MQKKNVIGLKGSSYHNQEVLDITNANERIKLFGMILFTYEKHLINNYSPQAKWILVNIPRDVVEGNIHQYSRAWGE